MYRNEKIAPLIDALNELGMPMMASTLEGLYRSRNFLEMDHLSLLKRARRVRLLEAAVSRCRSDLSPASVQSSISARPAAKASDAGPYSFCPLDADYCRALESLVSSSGEDASLRIPPLFPSVPDPDPKARVRALAASCSEDSPVRPLPYLFEKVLSLCRGELADVRFHPDTGLYDVFL